MKKILFYSLLLLGWMSNAQITGSLNGLVQDEKNQPIPGASVYLEGTEIGSQTDFDGLFRLENITPGSYNLIVSYVGFDTQTRYNVIVQSKGNAPMTFVLKEASEQLEEVVISKKNTISRPRETPLSTQTIS
ncbi:MAG: carboxypeptidase-like regulatory domain-containing protein, partial [Flavobacteriaceae bacterium]